MHDRIRALLALAQHPGTPLPEAEAALAAASRLMHRHGITEHDLGDAPDDTGISVERVACTGRYVPRRLSILWSIARAHSCTGYRDTEADGTGVLVLYGRPADIFAARTLFTAADALAVRALPAGARSWRTTWLKGFQRGIEEALDAAREDHIAETAGAGIVLRDRLTRAEDELRATGPRLRGTWTWADTASGAFADGERTGRTLSARDRSFSSGVRGELT
jgi:hypothetical protein